MDGIGLSVVGAVGSGDGPISCNKVNKTKQANQERVYQSAFSFVPRKAELPAIRVSFPLLETKSQISHRGCSCRLGRCSFLITVFLTVK